MATERQIEANRRNAARSTGPKSAEGKDTSRRNALSHGLTGAGVVLSEADEATIGDRLEAWAPSHGDLPPERRWALVEMVRESVRIDRCHEEEWALRRRAAERAEACWDDDRSEQAEELGHKLSRRPSLVARKLAGTPQGCRWLADRWTFLRDILRAGQDWDNDRRRQAQDLLGIPAEFRDEPGPLDLPAGSTDPEALRSHRLAVVQAELDRLRRLMEGPAAQLDESERQATASGFGATQDAAISRLRRYHAACHRRLAAASKALDKCRPASAPPAAPPSQVPAPETGDIPEEELELPAGLPDYPRSNAEPARPLNRHQRRALAQRQKGSGMVMVR